jgi:hypothetical protein
LEFGQEIVRKSSIKQHVVEPDVPLGSGLKAWDDSQPVGQVIFRAFEVHAPEYSAGPKFR